MFHECIHSSHAPLILSSQAGTAFQRRGASAQRSAVDGSRNRAEAAAGDDGEHARAYRKAGGGGAAAAVKRRGLLIEMAFSLLCGQAMRIAA